MIQDAREDFFNATGEKDRYWSVQRFKKGLKAYSEKMGVKIEIIMNNSRTFGEKNREYFIYLENGSEVKPFAQNFLKGH